ARQSRRARAQPAESGESALRRRQQGQRDWLQSSGPTSGWLAGVAKGRWIDTVVPRSTPALAASILPPLAVTKAFAIHRPRPGPGVGPDGAPPGNNRAPGRASSCAVSPPPSSWTESATPRLLRLAVTVIGEPAGEYFAALSTICPNACSTSTGST